MSFSNQKSNSKPESMFKRMELLHRQIARETYATAISTVVDEILNRPPNPPSPAPGSTLSAPIAARD